MRPAIVAAAVALALLGIREVIAAVRCGEDRWSDE